ncbi:hypothetical protein RhiirA1_403625 [Rhizophagus irregularis]|uniref:Uncharacterized protein n=1 Tax=Rhizophagus irregularis TaxID=588596 RepID=A0A2I1FFD3_9GLOM|nr:hypothetical protein RhiirA1_403625 [Rhizophagus irregularis]PKY33027.1 hypothetical protein RhiirB3_394478 [Rhizophagus irregularis]
MSMRPKAEQRACEAEQQSIPLTHKKIQLYYQQGLFDEALSLTPGDDCVLRYGVLFKTCNIPILSAINIDDSFNFAVIWIVEKIDQYQNYKSDWSFDQMKSIFIKITQFQPLESAGHIDLPTDLAAKKEVVNPKNIDLNGQF